MEVEVSPENHKGKQASKWKSLDRISTSKEIQQVFAQAQ